MPRLLLLVIKTELYIYMKKWDITPQLKSEWLEKLNKDYPQIKFVLVYMDVWKTTFDFVLKKQNGKYKIITVEIPTA